MKHIRGNYLGKNGVCKLRCCWMKKLWILLCFVPHLVFAQALRGTTGLLHAPSAVMEEDKTFKFGGNVLDIIPLHYYKFDVPYTFNYYVNITFFPWMEVGYTCTINYANEGSTYFPPQSWGKYTNQDRSFYFRFRLWKEGWWKEWTPQIALGLDDPGTHEHYGGGAISNRDENGTNCFFTRYYLAATKHFEFNGLGKLGVHSAFVMDRPATWKRRNLPSCGADFRFNLPKDDNLMVKALNGLDVIAEYDARTVNVGMIYSLWKEHINVVAELNDGKYFSGGVFFRVHL